MSSKRQTRGNAIRTIAHKTDVVLDIIAKGLPGPPADATR